MNCLMLLMKSFFVFNDSKKIDVSKSFNNMTSGWGVTQFNDVIEAWETDVADYLQGRKDCSSFTKDLSRI